MILEFFSGAFVALGVSFFFRYLNLKKSLDTWIETMSEFIYISGHPLMDDDEIHKEIVKKYGNLFYSIVLLISKIFLLLLVIAAFIVLSAHIVFLIDGGNYSNAGPDDLLKISFPTYLLQLPFLLGTLAPIVFVPFIKKRKKADAHYSELDKFLHYSFMGNSFLSKLTFKIDTFLNRKKLKKDRLSKSVYVSGLARSGSTALMQYLGQLDIFKSLSYKNLPFVFMPGTWPKLVKEKHNLKHERMHRDGILHGLNTYEALEEPFWRNNLGKTYIKEKYLVKHDIDDSTHEKYCIFRQLVSGDKIYLAKNNNHLLRAADLHIKDGKSGIQSYSIIPFRNPFDQAHSLKQQHELLSELQEDDKFTLDYMDFLVHHEFGLNNKVSVLRDLKDVQSNSFEQESQKYWLDVWLEFYKDALDLFKDSQNVCFFCFESFVEDPKGSLLNLIKWLEMDPGLIEDISFKEYEPRRKREFKTDNQQYLILYQELVNVSIN